MREILFKAKRLDIGEWVEGYYAFASEILCKDNVHVIFTGDGFNWWYEIDPQTVCQYTGLTDKNGVKIFEGDKTYYDWYNSSTGSRLNVLMKIGFLDGEFCMIPIGKYKDRVWNIRLCNEQNKIEIIGNIHDKEE